MSKMITDLLQRKSGGDKMTSTGVTQAMRAEPRTLPTQQVQAALYYVIHTAGRQRSKGSLKSQKQLSSGTRGPDVPKVTQNRLAYRVCQGVSLDSALLGTRYANDLVFPVNVLQ